MKKSVLFVVVSVVLMTTVGLNSCQKENPLIGTTWESEQSVLLTVTFKFVNRNKCTMTSTSFLTGKRALAGKYTYSDSTVEITVEDKTFSGVVTDNTMAITFEEGLIVVFTQK